MNSPMNVVVGGLRIARLGRQQLAARMREDCLAARAHAGAQPKLVFSANGNSIARVARDVRLRALYDRADLIHADGQPVVFASRLLTRTPIPERSATTDFFIDAAAEAARSDLGFFLLGASEEVNARCAAVLKARFPALRIAGRHHGYFSRSDEARICERINASGADIVWVALGVPLEQGFSVRNAGRLHAGWLITCGGCFDFCAGAHKRAPVWMQSAGFEWLFRLAREPRRLFWRYAITNPQAMFYLATRSGGPATASALTKYEPIEA